MGAKHKRWQAAHREVYLAQRARANSRRNKRGQQIIRNYKLAHPCVCGESDPYALDFHHPDPLIKREIEGRMGLARLLEEMQKCTVMCANCHRKGHAGHAREEHRHLFPAIVDFDQNLDFDSDLKIQ